MSGAKTVVVEVGRVYHHPLYHKRMRSSKTYLTHFEGEAKVGQLVVIEESRPISKSKRWVLVEAEGKPVGSVSEVREVKPIKEKKKEKGKAPKKVRRAKR